MDKKLRCQSCGMPLSEEFGNFGVNSDGSLASEYCMFCFANGNFTNNYNGWSVYPDTVVELLLDNSNAMDFGNV